MAAHQPNGELLSSWKEISDYLGCDERTCRRWELSLGLPVRRLEGTAKSRVYAYKAEVEAWRKDKLNGASKERKGPGSSNASARRGGRPLDIGKPIRKRQLVLWLIPATIVALAAVFFLIRSSPGEPTDFGIRGSKLIVLDEKGKTLWDFETRLDKPAPEEKYRNHFQVRGLTKEANPASPLNTDGQPLFPRLAFKDIDRDGRLEVLFCPKSIDEYNETGLFCLDQLGKELWHYKPGREIDFGGTVYSAEYRIDGFEPRDVDGDGNFEIFLITSHQPHSPSGLVLLDCHGQQLGEFYNFGRIGDLAFADVDGDGTTEVVAGGMNDEYGKASLAVFDPSRIAGSSPQSKDFASRQGGHGTEEYYLLFPRTDVDLVMYPPKENIKAMHLLEGNRLELDMHISHVYFELDFGFKVIGARGSDSFRETHAKMKAAGQVTSELNDAYWSALRDGVLYWNGSEWTSTPAKNRPPAAGRVAR